MEPIFFQPTKSPEQVDCPNTIHVVELATVDNFDEDAYNLANPDIGSAGVDAREHFDRFGQGEGRNQFSREYIRLLSQYRAQKFQKFRDILDIGEEYLRSQTFPITAGSRHFEASDYVQESANPGFLHYDNEIKAHPDRLYADIGCGFRDQVHLNCLYIDVYPSRTADLVVDPTCLYPIRSSLLDGIGCFAVLEHVRKPWVVVQEMYRMLKPGGKVFIDWPFLVPVHGFPSHFFNATREGLKSLFEDNGFQIEIAATGAHQSPAYTVHWVIHYLFERMPEGATKSALLDLSVRELAGLTPQDPLWQRAISELSDSALSEFAAGNWILGIKE